MARVPRTRSYPRTFRGYDDVSYDGVLTNSYPKSITFTSTIDDYHGRPVAPSPMSSTQIRGCLQIDGDVTGINYNGRWTDTFRHYPYAVSSSGLTTTPLAAPSGWYLDTIARTNPSRPGVTPLELLQDLVEIPSMLRDAGNLLMKSQGGGRMTSKEVANHYLCAQFGWVPLIRDIKELLDLQSSIMKRQKELQRLYSKGGLRRRLQFGEDTQSGKGTYSFPLMGSGSYVNALYDIKVIRRSWATIRWRPIFPLMCSPKDEELHRTATQVVSGLTVEGMAKGMWQILPWTWLVGWFTNVGKYALAYSNTVPATHSEACFMSESRRIYVANGFANVGVIRDYTRNSGVTTTTQKTRIVSGSITPGFNVPFLDTFRLSILGALFTQRLR